MLQDNVLEEIENLFLDNGFEKTLFRGYKNESVFKYKDEGYYMISKGKEAGYYLEFAETAEEAQNKTFEDIAHFPVAWNSDKSIDDIKNEVYDFLKEEITMVIPGKVTV